MTDTDTPERELIERLREPDTHDPAYPFRWRCYCDEGSPHDNVQDDDKLKAADTIEALLSKQAELEEAGMLAWAALGFYRDNMPPEAVERFQELFDIIAPLKTAPNRSVRVGDLTDDEIEAIRNAKPRSTE